MKVLSIAGTAAMFLVGGGILVHGLPALHVLLEPLASGLAPWLGALVALLLDVAVGIVAGTFVLLSVGAARRLRGANPA
jgi:hypothetical protein